MKFITYVSSSNKMNLAAKKSRALAIKIELLLLYMRGQRGSHC